VKRYRYFSRADLILCISSDVLASLLCRYATPASNTLPTTQPPSLYVASVIWNIAVPFGIEKLEWLGYQNVKKF